MVQEGEAKEKFCVKVLFQRFFRWMLRWQFLGMITKEESCMSVCICGFAFVRFGFAFFFFTLSNSLTITIIHRSIDPLVQLSGSSRQWD